MTTNHLTSRVRVTLDRSAIEVTDFQSSLTVVADLTTTRRRMLVLELLAEDVANDVPGALDAYAAVDAMIVQCSR